MNPNVALSSTEALLNALAARFAASVAVSGTPSAGTPLAGLSVGSDLEPMQSRKLPWLSINLADVARRCVTADGQVENRARLTLTVSDAASHGHAAILLAHRWAAWIENVLLPEGERNGPALGGLAEGIDPEGVHVTAGGLGFSGFTVEARFQLRYSTVLGAPFAA